MSELTCSTKAACVGSNQRQVVLQSTLPCQKRTPESASTQSVTVDMLQTSAGAAARECRAGSETGGGGNCCRGRGTDCERSHAASCATNRHTHDQSRTGPGYLGAPGEEHASANQ